MICVKLCIPYLVIPWVIDTYFVNMNMNALTRILTHYWQFLLEYFFLPGHGPKGSYGRTPKYKIHKKLEIFYYDCLQSLTQYNTKDLKLFTLLDNTECTNCVTLFLRNI